MDCFVRHIVMKMMSFELINDTEKESYIYYIELALEKIIAIGTIFLMALLMNRIVETILFITVFSCIRRYAGGYHCRTFMGCYVLSLVVTYICVCPLGDIRLYLSRTIFFLATVCSLCVILLIGAVNHPDMNWDEVELHNSKNMARSVTVILGGALLCIWQLDLFQEYVFFMAEGIWTSALSMLVAKILRQEVRV